MKTILTLLICVFLTSLSYAQVGKTYHVNSNSLNLRTDPSTTSQVIDKLTQYDNVIVLNDSISADWYQVSFNNTEGYAAKKYLKKGKAIATTYQIRTGAVCNDGTHSTATGRGACSHHGGVAYWKTKTQKSVRIVED